MIQVERGFPGRDRQKAAELFWAAFEGKLGRCMGPKAKACEFLKNNIQPHFSFSAYDGETLLGLVGFKDEEGGFFAGEYKDLVQVYGYISSVWRGLALSTFERELEKEQMLLDGIFVAESAQGMGVGTALLDAIENHARFELCQEMRLDVIDRNIKAKALYERRGFVPSGKVKTGLLKPLLGFSSATTMIKAL